MSLTAISSLESALKKFSSTRRTSCIQSRNHLFLGSGCENESNSQTRSSRREENFSWTRRTWCVESWNQTFLAQDAKMSLTAIISRESARRKFFMKSTYIMSTKWESLVLGSGCQNESNSHELAPIGEKKIFHELDVHHVYKVGITCFWAQDDKMSLTAISSLESARRKFFMNSSYIMSTK